MPRGSPIVYGKIEDMPPEPYEDIQDMLAEYHPHGISESCFETTHKEMFKRSLDYNLLGVKTFEELLVKLCDEGMVLVDKHPTTNERHVKLAYKHKGSSSSSSSSSSKIHDRPTESSDLYQHMQYLISDYGHGVSLYWLEKRYHSDFGRLPDYGSVGVNDLKELIGNMEANGRVLVFEDPDCKAELIGNMEAKGRVLVFEDPDCKATYVMCAWVVDSFRKFLKNDVLALLDAHGGEIPLSCFDCAFEDRFKLKLKYYYYGFKDIYHLCEVLNLGLEETDSPGEKVIKAHMIYNTRKRKSNG